MKKYVLPIVLVTCTLVVAFWQIMARWSAQPFRPFDLTASDFAGFRPELPGWEAQVLPVATNDPVEPNILALQAIHTEPAISEAPVTVLIRLVHGYNMPMCMKIKGYTVTAIGDLRQAASGKREAAGISRPPFPAQLWRVTASSGEAFIWVTTMVRAGDFEPTDVDICSMAFPRVDIPDDPRWIPQGFSWSDLRHPFSSLRRWARARWNASRTDVLTFLRLRQPAWASEELLSCVTRSVIPASRPEMDEALTRRVIEAHGGMLRELRKWRTSR